MLKVALAIVMVFVACGANVFFLEHLVKFSPGCGDLVTFVQFLFTATSGIVTVTKFGTQKPVVPVKEYMIAVILYFVGSLSGNLAFSCNISMPIQMIFKSGSVMASMFLGVVILNRKYSTSKYLSVLLITIGIATCLVLSSSGKASKGNSDDTLSFIFGILLLVVSLLTGARLGIAQEQIVRKFGKHPKEMTCYIHMLSLPFFAFFWKSIWKQLNIFASAEPVAVAWLPFDVPTIWLYFAMNIFTQFLCVFCVTILTSELSALAITVVLTIRKFMSLIVSILYFRNPFSFYHWLGTVLVLSGTLIFADVPQLVLASVTGSKTTDQKKKKEN